MAGLGISGKDGDVKIGSTAICEIRKWSFSPKANNPSYASNKTAGYTRRVPGIKDGSGSMEGAWDPASPAVAVIDPATAVTLKLYINATQFYEVPSVIDEFGLNVEVESGEIVSWTSTFSANGAWTNPVAGMTLPPGLEPMTAGPDGEPVQSWEFEPATNLQDAATPLASPAPGSKLTAADVSAVAQMVIAQMPDVIRAVFAEEWARRAAGSPNAASGQEGSTPAPVETSTA